jgi:hypothetical protein
VRNILHAGDRGLVLARQVGELGAADVAALDLLDRRGAVDDLVGGDARDRRITRGQSPQASVVDSPTASSCSQMVGTSSIRIQWYWMFCRSVMSAVFRA